MALDSDYSAADLERRIEARRAARGERVRVRCLRCLGAIPPTRRIVAKFCSIACKTRHNWDRIRALQREIYLQAREAKTTPACPSCGVALDAGVRRGPPPTACRKCRNRENMRRLRAAARAE